MLTDVERTALDDHRQAADAALPQGRESIDARLYFGLRLVLEGGRLVRAHRGVSGSATVTVKTDGSPATDVEALIEQRLRTWLAALGSNVAVVGEETGGELPARGAAIAVDPIDGTRAFLTETETYSTTVAQLEDGAPVVGLVSNPATGEIAYATAGGPARLIRLSVFGEPDAAETLAGPPANDGPFLVNLHPSRYGAGAAAALHAAWTRRDIAMVRSPGGSPAWGLVEAARGHFVYANLWSRRATEAFDLAAAVLIVRRAGGDVVAVDGRPIDALCHSGPFVAGLDPARVSRVTDLLRDVT
jgi:fructose-1,6-bisphosphatase/inositol monophosphatase family enzyme